MTSCSTIVLIGPRAAGKTAVGRAVGALLGRPFVDLDDMVRARFAGSSVAEIWARHGEAAFRAAEADALAGLLTEGTPTRGKRAGVGDVAPTGMIVALGGGTPMIDSARQRLDEARASGRARVVLLLADTPVLAARIERDGGTRPSLTGASPSSEVEEVLAARLPTYRALADATFDTASASIAEVAAAVAGWVRATR